MTGRISILGIPGIPEIKPGDDLVQIIFKAAQQNQICFEDHDVVVVAQKIVSKSEGCVYDPGELTVSAFALQVSAFTNKSPQQAELILRQSKRIVRMADGLLITQTHHGFIMANAGVDASNTGGAECLVTLPEDPDRSAALMREGLEIKSRKNLAVIISDTFGRPWRNGQVNQAIGVSGLSPLVDYRGKRDDDHKVLNVTEIAIADELASAAELVSGKTNRKPVVIIRGFKYKKEKDNINRLIRETEKDLFK